MAKYCLKEFELFLKIMMEYLKITITQYDIYNDLRTCNLAKLCQIVG